MAQIGRLDRRVLIQRRNQTRGDRGGMNQTWEDVGTLWAKLIPIEDAAGEESYKADRKTTVKRVKYIVRYHDTIVPTAKRRLVDGSNYYEITRVQEHHVDGKINRKNFLIITCELNDG